MGKPLPGSARDRLQSQAAPSSPSPRPTESGTEEEGPVHHRTQVTRLTFLAVSLLALAGCTVGPDYHGPPASPTPAQWKAESAWKTAQPRDAEIKQRFWEVFQDPVLDALELQASTNSPDVHAAFARLEQARAVARIARADLFPTVGLDPSYTREHFSANRGAQPGAAVLGYTANEFILPLDLSYELDLWGRVRRSFRSARELAQAGAAAYRNLLLSLQADVAQTYLTMRSVDLNRRVVAEEIELRKKNLALVQSLHEGGAGSALETAQADSELASAQAEWIGLNLRRAQLENALGTLCGQTASTFHLEETTRTYRPPPIPAGLPADLLERRPDVAQAERAMAAASENVGIAKAAWFPSVHLTGSAGVESMELQDLFKWDSRAWSLGPSVALPLFAGGRLRSGMRRAEAAYLEAVDQYRSQVLTAFREVEDGLSGIRLLNEQFDTQMRALAGAKKVAELSRLRYKEGLASYFEVVIADRTVLETEITAYGLNGQRMVTTVQLIKALGGGWKPDEAPSAASNFSPLATGR